MKLSHSRIVVVLKQFIYLGKRFTGSTPTLLGIILFILAHQVYAMSKACMDSNYMQLMVMSIE